uniref:Major sperm protein n=1 Tax=Bursaphelenchus xylophilus TaxID=6326 RepID=A0A1I7SW97_BURXY
MLRKEVLPPERDPPQPPFILKLPMVPRAPDQLALTIDPPRAWFTTLGGISKHLLCNHGPDRLAMKVRCSNNHAFRVNPVFSFLSEGQTQEFELIRLQGGEPRKDKVQLLFTIARDSDNDPVQLFGNNSKVRSVVLHITTI